VRLIFQAYLDSVRRLYYIRKAITTIHGGQLRFLIDAGTAIKKHKDLSAVGAGFADPGRIKRTMRMKVSRGILLIALLLAALLPQSARSEDKPLWELGIGAAFLQMPDYRGSDENRFYALPYPYAIYRGDIFKFDGRQISGKIFKTDRILLDVSAYGSVPVRSNDNAARSGMPDLDPTFELGPALKIILMGTKTDSYQLSLSLPVRAVFSTDFHSVHNEGWVFSPRINLEKKEVIPNTGVHLGVSAGPMFADRAYNAYFYTVEPHYATATRPAYSADAGYAGSTLTVGLRKDYKQLVFNAFVSADFLHGAVFEDSPLVKTKTSIMSGFTVSWIFFKSDKKVASDEK
jgi:outer membrane protein